MGKRVGTRVGDGVGGQVAVLQLDRTTTNPSTLQVSDPDSPLIADNMVAPETSKQSVLEPPSMVPTIVESHTTTSSSPPLTSTCPASVTEFPMYTLSSSFPVLIERRDIDVVTVELITTTILFPLPALIQPTSPITTMQSAELVPVIPPVTLPRGVTYRHWLVIVTLATVELMI